MIVNYQDLPVSEWNDFTQHLVSGHPLPHSIIKEAVLWSWEQIHGSVIGGNIIIGETYFPTPQILGDFLHELIPIRLHEFDKNWRKGIGNTEKDIFYEKDDFYSIEIKTSSQKGIYGNRSYAQKNSQSAKSKSGFYLAINFPPIHKLERWENISKIRFGWIDAEDWKGQSSETGQQASLSKEVLENKLITLYSEE